jgi:hypothetical protein
MLYASIKAWYNIKYECLSPTDVGKYPTELYATPYWLSLVLIQSWQLNHFTINGIVSPNMTVKQVFVVSLNIHCHNRPECRLKQQRAGELHSKEKTILNYGELLISFSYINHIYISSLFRFRFVRQVQLNINNAN